jgi:hypothetical protein
MKIVDQYNQQLTNKELGLGKVVSPDGELVDRKKYKAKLGNGKTVEVDQFGYTWE